MVTSVDGSIFFSPFIRLYYILIVIIYFAAICYGPFVRLAPNIQELAICCLYYFSFMDSLLLQSLVSCCLCKYHITHLWLLFALFCFLSAVLDFCISFCDSPSVCALFLSQFLSVDYVWLLLSDILILFEHVTFFQCERYNCFQGTDCFWEVICSKWLSH